MTTLLAAQIFLQSPQIFGQKIDADQENEILKTVNQIEKKDQEENSASENVQIAKSKEDEPVESADKKATATMENSAGEKDTAKSIPATKKTTGPSSTATGSKKTKTTAKANGQQVAGQEAAGHQDAGNLNDSQQGAIQKDGLQEDSSKETKRAASYALVEEFRDYPEVVYWREFYMSEKMQKVLQNILESAVEYRVYVRKAVTQRSHAQHDFPLELEYLPVVESGYKTAARSKSGAVGMWQFMANSVRPFLRLSEYVDERLDPWLSTEAGLSKLHDNYRTFNNWPLAIGAYNCGVGAMNRAIKKAGTSDYWELARSGAIAKQTAEYLPKLIAITDLAENPELYGINLPHHDQEYEELLNAREAAFDYVSVKKPYMINQIAKESGIAEKELRHLNPSLTKGFTPPAIEFQIRVPAGKGQAVSDAIEKIKPIEFPFQYKVQKGDSLWSISRKYGVTVQQLCDTNGIKEKDILKIGKILYIPASKK